jgi:hypothetical protein
MAIVATHADERDGGTEDKRTAVFFSPRERVPPAGKPEAPS